ncbi:MAG: hypothetical protein ACI8UO_005710, partial [Verrucomicrobiales bacterium]
MASESSANPMGRKKKSPFNIIQRILIWLSGSAEDALIKCPRWEQRKYEAFGATVLVPTIFAMIASAYAVSTLTTEPWIIVPVGIIWGLIILTIDRVLLATYRAFANIFIKIAQFLLRIVVALLVGFTIAHPLTLLLFKDTIIAEVERERRAEMQVIVDAAETEKLALDQRITAAETGLAQQQQRYQETVTANFMDDPQAGENGPVVPNREPEERAALDAQVIQATQALKTQVASVDGQMAQHNEAYTKVQTELGHWQEEYEKEVDGSRSGTAGIGPRAKSIDQDQLGWRRDEIKRLGSLMTSLTQTRNQITNDIASTEKQLRDEYNSAVAAEAADMRAGRQEVAALERQLQSQQLNIFISNQEELLEQIQGQVDSNAANVTRLRDEAMTLAAATQEQVGEVSESPRNDLLTQTLVLHSLFEAGNEGGSFALIVYAVIAGLFMLVDTIPLVVKFFSKAGPYDYRILQEERLAQVAASIDPTDEDDLNRILVDRRIEKFARLRELQAAAYSVGYKHEGVQTILELPREVYENAEPIPTEAEPVRTAAVAAADAEVEYTETRAPEIHGNGFGESLILRTEADEVVQAPAVTPEPVEIEPARVESDLVDREALALFGESSENGNRLDVGIEEIVSPSQNGNGNGNGADQLISQAPVDEVAAVETRHEWVELPPALEPETEPENQVEPEVVRVAEPDPNSISPDDFVSDRASLPPETQLVHEPEPVELEQVTPEFVEETIPNAQFPEEVEAPTIPEVEEPVFESEIALPESEIVAPEPEPQLAADQASTEEAYYLQQIQERLAAEEQQLAVTPEPAAEVVAPPAPVEEVVAPPAPVEEFVAPPAPVEEFVAPPAPVEEIVAAPAPVEEIGAAPAPVEEFV